MAKSIATSTNLTLRGLLLSSLIVPIGIIAWLFLWQYGFIASVVAWGIAWGAVWLYNFGSGKALTRSTVPYILLIIIVGVLAAFLSGIIYDLWQYYTVEMNGDGGLLSEDFLAGVWSNLTYWEFMSSYTIDFLIALAFAVLGAGGIVYGLFIQSSEPAPAKKTTKKKTAAKKSTK